MSLLPGDPVISGRVKEAFFNLQLVEALENEKKWKIHLENRGYNAALP